MTCAGDQTREMGGNATKCYDGRGKPDGETAPNAGANGAAAGANGDATKPVTDGTAAGGASNGSGGGGDDPSKPVTRGQHEIAFMAIATKLFEEMDIDSDRRIAMADWIILDPLMSGGTVPLNGATPAPAAVALSRKKFRQYALMHGVTLPPAGDDSSLSIAREDYIKYYRSRMADMLDAEFPTEITGLRKQYEHTKQKIASYKAASEADRARYEPEPPHNPRTHARAVLT